MKRAKCGQDYIIIGQGATTATAWAMARKLSTRHRWANVIHPYEGNFHKVTCYNGHDVGHTYNVGTQWWSCGQRRGTVIAAKAEAMRNGGRPGTSSF